MRFTSLSSALAFPFPLPSVLGFLAGAPPPVSVDRLPDRLGPVEAPALVAEGAGRLGEAGAGPEAEGPGEGV